MLFLLQKKNCATKFGMVGCLLYLVNSDFYLLESYLIASRRGWNSRLQCCDSSQAKLFFVNASLCLRMSSEFTLQSFEKRFAGILKDVLS